MKRQRSCALKIFDAVFYKEPKLKKKNKYHGITYPKQDPAKWKGCVKNQHLFDEVLGCGGHYLSCDCCGLIVNIKSIDTQYVKKKLRAKE